MSDIVEALRREMSALETDLENDPRYRKIARIRSLLAEYTAASSHAPVNVMMSRPARAAQPNSKKSRVHDGIINFLAANPGAHRRDILSAIVHEGLLVDVKDPMASLAAYLSDFRSELQNLGQGRWSLKESAPNAEAPEPMQSLASGDQTGAA
jgi:hypothetical protein